MSWLYVTINIEENTNFCVFSTSFLIADSFQLFPLSCLVTWLFHSCTFMFLDFQIEAQMVNGGVFAEPPRQRGDNSIFKYNLQGCQCNCAKWDLFLFIWIKKKKKLTSGICNHAVMTGCLIKWIFTVLHWNEYRCTGLLFRRACKMFVLNLFGLTRGYPGSLSFLK